MQEIAKLVADKVESGSYFKDARDWYASKYLSPYGSRILIALSALIALLAVFIVGKVSNTTFSKQEYPFPIHFENQVQYFSQIKPLTQGNETIFISIARYLLDEYVITRESYDYTAINNSAWEAMLRKVKSMSSRKVFNEYMSYIDSSNPDSPIIIYKTHTKKLITIENTEFVYGNDLNPTTAKVYFSSIEFGKYGSSNKIHWVAEISFIMNSIQNIKYEKLPLQFTVISYKVNKL